MEKTTDYRNRIKALEYIAVGPIRGLEDFCKKYGLTRSLMDKVYTGERRSHKGWTAKRD